MKIFLFIFIGLFFSLSSLYSEDQCYLRLHIKGIEYDSLQLVIRTDGESHRVNGITTDKQSWLFLYSDSIYERHTRMSIEAQNTDSLIQLLGFSIPTSNQDTLKVGDFSFERKAVVNAQFLQTGRYEKLAFFRFRDFIDDDFLVSYDDDKELSLMSSVRDVYSRFSNAFNDLSYDEVLKKSIEITAAHPSSQYLIARVASTLRSYDSVNDIKKIFQHFSDDNKSSYFGREINRYINMTFFENSFLPSWNTEQIEPIIQDTTKYSLIVFSASWCAPCHKLVPDLKIIHNELQNYMNIIYISLDEQRWVQNWRDFMIKENIPWRSLLAIENIEEIRNKYFVQGIPYSLFVYPDGKMERLDIIRENERMRIYEIIGCEVNE
jgi:thiol-disulfide isomerase/thioredoxin